MCLINTAATYSSWCSFPLGSFLRDWDASQICPTGQQAEGHFYINIHLSGLVFLGPITFSTNSLASLSCHTCSKVAFRDQRAPKKGRKGVDCHSEFKQCLMKSLRCVQCEKSFSTWHYVVNSLLKE